MDQLKQAAVLALLLLVVIRNTKATQTARVLSWTANGITSSSITDCEAALNAAHGVATAVPDSYSTSNGDEFHSWTQDTLVCRPCTGRQCGACLFHSTLDELTEGWNPCSPPDGIQLYQQVIVVTSNDGDYLHVTTSLQLDCTVPTATNNGPVNDALARGQSMTMGANCDLLRSGCVSGEECTSISSTCQCTFGTGHACDANDDCASGDCATLSRTCECQYDSDCHGGSTCTHSFWGANTCEIDSGPSQCGTGYSCAGDGITSSNKCFNDAGRKQTPIKELPFANLVIQASGGSMPGNSVAGSPIIKAPTGKCAPVTAGFTTVLITVTGTPDADQLMEGAIGGGLSTWWVIFIMFLLVICVIGNAIRCKKLVNKCTNQRKRRGDGAQELSAPLVVDAAQAQSDGHVVLAVPAALAASSAVELDQPRRSSADGTNSEVEDSIYDDMATATGAGMCVADLEAQKEAAVARQDYAAAAKIKAQIDAAASP